VGKTVRILAFCVLLSAFLSCHSEKQQAHVPQSSSIILVTIDTLRADSVGFAGNAHVRTPFLDRLASEGVVFTNAHAHNVITLPSHTNILTGLYPYQHGVRENSGFKLDASHATIATMLHGAGYTSGAFIAAFPLDARYGLNQGFDTYDDNYGKGAASLDFVLQERPATAVLDAAAKWWRANEGKKRFMWVHLYDPHAPYHPPQPFATEYAKDPYLGEIAAVDDALGKQLGPLLTDDTLVVITADHGEALGDHGELTHGLFAYESTLHIPLLVWKKSAVKHRVDADYVRHIDIAPTILEAADVTKPAPLQGCSLLGAPCSVDSYFESLSTNINRGWAPLTGIIHNREKYIDLPIAELYDLPRDPGEINNLRAEKRRDVEEARRLLASIHADVKARRTVSTEEAAQLRSLGYISGGGSTKTSYTDADDPKNLVALDGKMHQVIDSYEHHDIATALKLAKEVVAERPDMSAGRELLAFVLQQSERVPEAIENLRAAIRTGDVTQSMRVQLALLLTEQGKTAEAVQVLEPLAKGNDPDALNAYGIALADQGKVDQASQVFQRVLQTDPNNAPALQNLGIVALRRNDISGAQSFLSRALELNPRLPLALNTLGVVYARQSDFARAVDAWSRAVQIDPRQYDALYNIGFVEGRAGHVEEARRALSQFVATAPKERYGQDIATAKQALASLPR
jgi:arylsulfatase A-like enzyme/tetratricopeptide (TPR) repeat protein